MDASFQALQNELNEEPKTEEIDSNQGRLFVPIGFVEAKLDRIFYNLWKTENEKTTIVGNEILVSLELHVYFYPIQQWIIRVGVGAAMIQQRQTEEGKPARISDVDAKISNTMQKDYPHAKAEAVKNAAKSLGATFGRNLGRKLGKFPQELKIKTAGIDEIGRVSALLNNASDLDELQLLWETANNAGLSRLFNVKRAALKSIELAKEQKQLKDGGGK